MSGSSTLAKLPNGGERRTSLATTFSPAPGMSTGTKATESQCQLFNFGQQHVTNYYSLVRLSSDKGAGAFNNAQHGSALGTDSYTLPSGTGPGTTGKPGTPTNRKHTRRLLPNLVNNLHLGVESNYAKQVQDTINSDVATAGTKLGNGNDNGKFSSKLLARVNFHVFQMLPVITEDTLTLPRLTLCHRNAHLKMLHN